MIWYKQAKKQKLISGGGWGQSWLASCLSNPSILVYERVAEVGWSDASSCPHCYHLYSCGEVESMNDRLSLLRSYNVDHGTVSNPSQLRILFGMRLRELIGLQSQYVICSIASLNKSLDSFHTKNIVKLIVWNHFTLSLDCVEFLLIPL